MKRRAAIYFFGTVFGVLALALGLVHSERFAEYVRVELEQRAGSELAADVSVGSVRIKLLSLQPRVVAYDIKVFPNEPGKSRPMKDQEPTIQADSVGIFLRPLQLWARQLDVDRIEVVNPHLDLVQKNGKWAGLPPGLFIDRSHEASSPATTGSLSFRLDAVLAKNGILHLSAETAELSLGLERINALATFEANGSLVVDVSADGRRVSGRVGEDWFEEFIESVDAEVVLSSKAIEVRGAALETDSLSLTVDAQVGLGEKTDITVSRIHAVAPLEFVNRVSSAVPEMSGTLDWTGTLRVDDVGFRAKGLATVDDYRLDRFHFGRTEADAEITANGAKMRRVAINGAGGKVEGPMEIAWPETGITIAADLGVQGASFARLLDTLGIPGAVVDSQLAGSVKFSGGVSPLSIDGQVDVAHTDFTWRDRAWDAPGMTEANIRLPAGKITGGYAVRDDGIGFQKVYAQIGTSNLSLDGKLFFAGSTDLAFSAAPLALGEISPIAGVSIAGTGPITEGRVSGKFEELVVEGNVDLKGFRVAGFDFGAGRGPIRFSVAEPSISSSNTVLVRGESTYGGPWKVGFSDGGSLDVGPVKVNNARIEDLSDIVFAEMKASSYAQGRIGEGTLRLKGPFRALNGAFNVKGFDLAVSGERFATYRVNGRWDEGAIWLDDLVATKPSGAQLYARGSMGVAPDGDADALGAPINLELHTSKWTLSDLNAMGEEPVLTSELGVRMHLGGRFYRPELRGTLLLEDSRLYGQLLNSSQLKLQSIATAPGGPKDHLQIEGSLAGGTIKPSATIHLKSTGEMPYDATVAITRHNLKPYLMYLNPRVAKDPEVKAATSAVVTAKGDLAKVGQSRVSVVADFLSLQRGPHQILNDGKIIYEQQGADYEIKALNLKGEKSEEGEPETNFSVRGGRKGGKQDITVYGQLDLALAGLATTAFSRVEGVLDVKQFDITDSGYGGDAEIVGGTFKTRVFPVGPEDMRARIRVKNGNINISGLAGKLGGGTFKMDEGEILLADSGCIRSWKLDDIELRDVKMKFPSYALETRVSGPLHFEGSSCGESLPILKGNLSLDYTKYYGLIQWKGSAVTLKAGATEVFVASDDPPIFKMNIEMRADRGNVLVKNDLMNIELKTDPNIPLRLIGNSSSWGVKPGMLRLVNGEIVIQVYKFALQQADIDFVSDKTVDVKYKVTASSFIRQWEVTANIEGQRSRGLQRFDLSSNPVLSTEDVNQLVTSGQTAQEAKASGNDLAAVGSLLGTTLGQGLGEQGGVTSRIKKVLNADAVDFVPSYTEGGAIGMKAVVRGQVPATENLSYTASFGQSDHFTSSVQLDYRASQRIHIVGGWSNENTRDSSASESDALKSQGDVNLDAKFRFEWK